MAVAAQEEEIPHPRVGLVRVVEEKKARSAVACGRGGKDPVPSRWISACGG